MKIIASFLGILILLVVFAGILLITFVNPNHFKPLVAQQVQKYTGRQLTIEGDLSWSFYPYFGIKVGRTQLNNVPGFQQKIFAEWESATVGVKLLPLIHARIESAGMAFKGLKLNLIKKADGKINWENLQTPMIAAEPHQDPTPVVTAKKGLVIVINSIDVSDASIHWINEQAKQDIQIDQLNLEARNIILGESFPLNAEFHFVGNNPAFSGKAHLSSKVFFDLDKKLYRLKDFSYSMQIHQGDKNIKMNSSASVLVDLVKDQMEFNNWKGKFEDVAWRGKLSIQRLTSQPYAMGSIQTDSFVLEDLLASLGQKDSAIQSDDVKADINFTFDNGNKSASAIKKFSFKGSVKTPHLKLSNLRVNNVAAQTSMQNGVLAISSLTGVFYQGNLTSDATIDLNDIAPAITFNAKLTNVQAEPLISDLDGDNQNFKLSGLANMECHLSSVVSDKFIRNLNGTLRFALDKGVMKGVDINYLAGTAYALARREMSSGTNTNQTEFGNLTGTAIIRNGIISNNDFLLDIPKYQTKGKGNIDLVNLKIDYSLETKSKQNPKAQKELANLYGLGIPIFVKGNLLHPSIGLDTLELTKQMAKQEMDIVKDKAVKKIEEKFGVKIPKNGAQLIRNILG